MSQAGETELPTVGRQRLVAYGLDSNALKVYASVYTDAQVRHAIQDCCARYGNACGARAVDGVSFALRQQATDPEFGEVVGKQLEH